VLVVKKARLVTIQDKDLYAHLVGVFMVFGAVDVLYGVTDV
jgi:hypothetical protein